MDEAEIDRLLEPLERRAQERGISALNEEERNLLVTWWALGDIGNGGFRFFFEGGLSLADVSRRMRAIGLGAPADACDHVLAVLFPGVKEPVDLKARNILVADVDWKQFERQEEILFALLWDELIRVTSTYVAEHPAAFGMQVS